MERLRAELEASLAAQQGLQTDLDAARQELQTAQRKTEAAQRDAEAAQRNAEAAETALAVAQREFCADAWLTSYYP